MDDKLQVLIVTPYNIFLEGKADMLVLPAIDGEIGIMPGHSPIVIALNPGELRIVNDEDIIYASISDGFAQIEVDNAVVVVGSAESPEKIDINRARATLARAQERINSPDVSEREKTRSRRSVLRAKARIKVAEKIDEKPLSFDL